MSFQWDILLLEVGFLAFLFAPFLPYSFKKYSLWARVIREMIKWLVVRLMISSGLTKMFSGCPTWWKFTALNYHFETQPLPTPLAWYAHNANYKEIFLALTLIA